MKHIEKMKTKPQEITHSNFGEKILRKVGNSNGSKKNLRRDSSLSRRKRERGSSISPQRGHALGEGVAK